MAIKKIVPQWSTGLDEIDLAVINGIADEHAAMAG